MHNSHIPAFGVQLQIHTKRTDTHTNRIRRRIHRFAFVAKRVSEWACACACAFAKADSRKKEREKHIQQRVRPNKRGQFLHVHIQSYIVQHTLSQTHTHTEPKLTFQFPNRKIVRRSTFAFSETIRHTSLAYEPPYRNRGLAKGVQLIIIITNKKKKEE